MYSLHCASRKIFNIPYSRLRKKLIELGYLIRFKEIEIIVNHDYLTYERQTICFTEEGIHAFGKEMWKDWL